MYYTIREILEPVAEPVIGEDDAQYVALLSNASWRAQEEQFDLGINIEDTAARFPTTVDARAAVSRTAPAIKYHFASGLDMKELRHITM